MPVKLTDSQKDKKKRGLCITPYCKKKHGKQRNICYSCQRAQYMKKYPLEYTFQVWHGNTKRRKKVNTVTFLQFKNFVSETDYMNKRGTKCKSLQIDRDKDCGPDCPREWCYTHGYHAHNIKGITLRENMYKEHARRKGQPAPVEGDDDFVPF